MIRPVIDPHGWNRSEADADSAKFRRLSASEIAEFDSALVVIRASGKPLLQMNPSDFPLKGPAKAVLLSAVREAQSGRGFQLLRGFPVDRWSVEDTKLVVWGIGMQLGVARPQGKASHFLADVRDAGGQYRGVTGRGYNTNAELDFHNDSSDLVGLLCLRTAKSGGTSLLTSSVRAHNEMLATRPDLVEELYRPFIFSRQGEHAPEEPPYYQTSIFGTYNGRFACRYVRNHINSAQMAFADIPRLTARQVEALDMLDATVKRADLCFQMEFEPGDLQLINNYVVLHSRTTYQDHEEPDLKRHLMRLWIASPTGQELPADWKPFFKDTAAGAVRGGYRGQNITPEIMQFEERLAKAHGMHFRVYEDKMALRA
jgi:hypothetical protein